MSKPKDRKKHNPQIDSDFYLNKVGTDAAYYLLAQAILKQAVDDYIAAIVRNDKGAARRLERFFLSEHGQILSFDHGEGIIREARQIAKIEKEKDRAERDRMTRSKK